VINYRTQKKYKKTTKTRRKPGQKIRGKRNKKKTVPLHLNNFKTRWIDGTKDIALLYSELRNNSR